MRWLTKRIILEAHVRALSKYGGFNASTNEALFEATLARPQQLAHYTPSATLAQLSASYGYGFAKNHCFSDGNKRVAFYAVFIFLKLNNLILNAPEADATHIFESVAAGTVDEAGLCRWIEDNCD